MPVIKRKGGYSWGRRGKVFKTRAQAERQGRAIQASKRKNKRGQEKIMPHKPGHKKKKMGKRKSSNRGGRKGSKRG